MSVTANNKPTIRPPDANSIPAELRSEPHWVNWEWRERNGKWDKPPVSARGVLIDATKNTNWRDFETAAVSGDGIGFAFAPDDEFCGVDLDHCRDPETGVVAPWAQYVIDKLNSYTEASPSGTGVKVFIRGVLRAGNLKCTRLVGLFGCDDQASAIELYDHARYFCVTGQHVAGTPRTVKDRQEPLIAGDKTGC